MGRTHAVAGKICIDIPSIDGSGFKLEARRRLTTGPRLRLVHHVAMVRVDVRQATGSGVRRAAAVLLTTAAAAAAAGGVVVAGAGRHQRAPPRPDVVRERSPSGGDPRSREAAGARRGRRDATGTGEQRQQVAERRQVVVGDLELVLRHVILHLLPDLDERREAAEDEQRLEAAVARQHDVRVQSEKCCRQIIIRSL